MPHSTSSATRHDRRGRATTFQTLLRGQLTRADEEASWTSSVTGETEEVDHNRTGARREDIGRGADQVNSNGKGNDGTKMGRAGRTTGLREIHTTGGKPGQEERQTGGDKGGGRTGAIL